MRPTVAEINLSAIEFNLQQIKDKVAPAKIMAVVKANAYGHGALEVSRKVLETGASYLGVALLEEGVELRSQGIQAPILVFGGFFPDEAEEFLQHGLEVTLYNEENLFALTPAAQKLNQKARVHIEVDTGMGRVGVPWQKATSFVKRVWKTPEIEVIGLYTHLATADERDKTFANLQLTRFRSVIEQLGKEGINIPIKHAANSGAILDLPDSYFDMVRPGIIIYGYYPSLETSESLPLRPAMRLKSTILHVKEVSAGTSVSYGREFITPRTTRIVTIPVGYADGYNRLLSNRGEVIIRGKKYPVVGRVCMDQIMVDVGEDVDVEVGDEVVLWGQQGDVEISVYDLCRKLQTIPNEVCCWVSSRVPRVYENSGRCKC
ncbi:alanine racemase [candidate division KSB1 bacterium]|nr:MAG: alanine racemase [candidate division KSB1 bacterium]